MGNQPKKNKKTFLFELNPSSPYQVPPQNYNKSVTIHKIPTKPYVDPLPELNETLNFSTKSLFFSHLIENQLELTLSNLQLNYQSIENSQNYKKIEGFLNHAHILQRFTKDEIHNEFLKYNVSSQNLNKSVAMSPIMLRNSNKVEDFDTPSPLKSEYRPETQENEEIFKKTEDFIKHQDDLYDKPIEKNKKIEQNFEKIKEIKKYTKNQENSQKKEYFLRKQEKNSKTNEDFGEINEHIEKKQFFFNLKPNFVHFNFPKVPAENLSDNEEARIRSSIRKIDKKLNSKTQFLHVSKQKVKEMPLLELDLYKTIEKSGYTDPRTHLARNLPEYIKVENVENMEFDIKKNQLKTKKKSKNTKKSYYSKENLTKYLNKSYSDFSNNSKFLKYQERSKKKISFAENRGNYLHMKYDYEKTSSKSVKNHETENLETSIINLKKSLNLPGNSMKIIKKAVLHEKNEENLLDLQRVEVEKLRKSLNSARNSRVYQEN